MPSLTYILPKDVLNKNTILPKNQEGFRGLARFLYPALQRAFDHADYISPLHARPSLGGCARYAAGKLLNKETFWWTDPRITSSYARQIARKAKKNKNRGFFLSTELKIVAGLHSPIPLAVWQDAC